MRCFMVCCGLILGLCCLVGCGAGGGISGNSYNPGYGPFDQRGNYVEAWADKPAKKHWWGKNPTETPAAKSTTPPKEDPRIAAVNKRPPTPNLPTKPAPTVARVNPPRPTYTPKPVFTPPPIARPKPVVVKPKTPSRRHTVSKGDTLYSLSRKYGTSISAIQRANGLKGTTIVTGKSLVIPR